MESEYQVNVMLEMLTTTARRTRSQAIASSIAISFTLCRVAKSHISLKQAKRARILLQSLSQSKASLQQRVWLPGYVEPNLRDRFQNELTQLGYEIEKTKLMRVRGVRSYADVQSF